MENLEMSGRTVEEATQRALENLGVGREEVRVTVLKEGKPGILGVGVEEALVRVEPLVSASDKGGDIAEVARDTLEALLAMMGVNASIISQSGSFTEVETDTPVSFDVKGDDLGILIGRRGQTLSCLQYIVRLIVGHQTNTWVRITVDVEGYKQRRYEALQVLAWRMADQVNEQQVPFTLEPMSSYDRRIVHLTLAEHPTVTTESAGEGEARKVVIIPRRLSV